MRKILQIILRLLSKLILWKHKPTIIAITGSVGKTSTKEAVFAVVSKSQTARKSWGNFNTEIGVPYTIIGASNWFSAILKAKLLILFPFKYPKILILEMAADRPGDIAYLTSFVKPNISVVTSVGESHMEFFGSKKKIAAEKGGLVKALGKTGTAVLNHDDEEVRAIRALHKGNTLFYSVIASEAKQSQDLINALNISLTPDGLTFKFQYKGTVVPVLLPGHLGKPSVYAALAAAAVGVSLGMNLVEIAAALRDFQNPPGRLRLLGGVKNTKIIDDTYNAAPTSTVAALETLAAYPGKRKIAVLGDMAELGVYTEEGHRLVGAAVAKEKIDFLITVGPKAKFIADEAKQKGFPESQIMSFVDADEAGKPVEKLIQPDDVVLVKGSRMMHMEKIVLEVMAEPEKADELLVH